MRRTSGAIINCAIISTFIAALTTFTLFVNTHLTKRTALFASSTYESDSTGGIVLPRRLPINFTDPIDYNDNGVAFLFVVGLVPLLSFAGTDLWESFSAAGVLNAGFGIIVGAPIGSLGIFKAGLKKLFPDQLKSIDWESMDVVGSRERFIKYKAFIADPCAIDPSRKFQSMVFKKAVAVDAEWCATTENFEEIPGFKDRPQGEYLHGNNDDLMHLGRYETVVTKKTCDDFNRHLWWNGVFYTLLGWVSIGITLIPVVACMRGLRGPLQPELVAAAVWACLAGIYAPISAVTGFIAMRITESRGGIADKTETETLITYWQPELEQYRTGTFYSNGPPRVQNGFYSIKFRALTWIQGFLGVTTAIAAGLATVGVTNAVIAVISSRMPWHAKSALAFGPFLIVPLRFGFVLPIAHNNRFAPQLSGQKELSEIVLAALRSEADPWFLKAFLEPLRLSWLEGHRSVYQTTSHGGRWRYFPTQMVVEPTSSGGMRIVLPSACIVDGATLRNLIILLHKRNGDRDDINQNGHSGHGNGDTVVEPLVPDVTHGRKKPRKGSLAWWFVRATTHNFLLRLFMSILVCLHDVPRWKPKWVPWLNMLESIRPSASYFLAFKRNNCDGNWTKARAVRIPSEPWISQDCARGALYLPDFATDTPEDNADPTREICLRLQVPFRFVERNQQPDCDFCRQAQGHDGLRPGQTILYRQKSSRPKGLISLRTAGEAIVRHIGQSLPVWDDKERLEMTCLHALCNPGESELLLENVPLPSQQDSYRPLELWIYQHCQYQTSKVMLQRIPDGTLPVRPVSSTAQWMGAEIAIVDLAVDAMDGRRAGHAHGENP